MQIHLSCVVDGDHNVLLKLLGLEKAGISYKLLFEWSKLFCNTNVNRLCFVELGREQYERDLIKVEFSYHKPEFP